MATFQALLPRAFRLLQVRGPGDALSSDEAADALEVAQGVIYDLLVARAVLTDVEIETDYTAGENERIFNRDSVNATITLPETVTVTVSGTTTTRAPLNGAIVEIAGGPAHQAYAYVSHYGAWKRLQGLALTDDNPLGPAHDHDIAALTALRLAPEYLSHPTSDVLVALAAQARTSIRQRFRQQISVTTDPLINAPRLRRC